MAIVLTLVVLLGSAVVFGVARDPGPAPTDVAIGYVRALANRDFDALYRMTDDDVLRGRNRPRWMAEQAARPQLAMVAEAVDARSTVEVGDDTRVVVVVDPVGTTVTVDLVRRQRVWLVRTISSGSEVPLSPVDPSPVDRPAVDPSR